MRGGEEQEAEEGDLCYSGEKEVGVREVKKRAPTPTNMHTVGHSSKASRALGIEKKEKWHKKNLGG